MDSLRGNGYRFTPPRAGRSRGAAIPGDAIPQTQPRAQLGSSTEAVTQGCFCTHDARSAGSRQPRSGIRTGALPGVSVSPVSACAGAPMPLVPLSCAFSLATNHSPALGPHASPAVGRETGRHGRLPPRTCSSPLLDDISGKTNRTSAKSGDRAARSSARIMLDISSNDPAMKSGKLPHPAAEPRRFAGPPPRRRMTSVLNAAAAPSSRQIAPPARRPRLRSTGPGAAAPPTTKRQAQGAVRHRARGRPRNGPAG